jgi:hypothetical protein
MSYTKSLQNFRKRLLQDPTESAPETEAPKSLISRPTVFQPANTVQTQKNDPNAFIESTLRQIRNARMQFEERTAKSLAKAKEEDEITEQLPMLYRTKAPVEVPTTRGKLSEEKPMSAKGTGRSPADDELYADTSPYKRDGLDLLALSRAIKKIESGGGNYSARGPVVESGQYKGQRAMGAYQVMPGNLPAWSKAALGRVVSEDEFMSSKVIQDTIFLDQMTKSFDKYGSAEDAASVWFTGQPASKSKGRSDGYMKAEDYVSNFSRGYREG